MNKVIFAIDNNTDLHRVARFMRFIDECRAMNRIEGKFEMAIGMWEGEMESSYMMDEADYRKLVVPSGYALDQVCVLVVEPSNKCYMEYPDGDVGYNLGVLTQVTPQEAMGMVGWTYILETKTYWAVI